MKKMQVIDYNLHQHTLFSDGKEVPEKFAEKAVELGFRSLGFSEHSPLPFDNPFSLKEEKIDEYIESVETLKESFRDKLTIYRSLEMDFIPGMSEDFEFWRNRCRVDYLIGSVHLVRPEGSDELWFTDGPDIRVYDKGVGDYFEGDIRKAVGAFYDQTNRMIESQQFEVIGHFDKIKMHNRGRFFTDKDKWYRDLVDETLELMRARDIIAEVNTRGVYTNRSDTFFPDGYALQRAAALGIPVVISSDAHHPEEINKLFDTATTHLAGMGIGEVVEYRDGQWRYRPLY